MRVVVIGDVHANVEALTALADLLDDADQIVCVGDVVGYYCQVNEAICAIRERNVLCVAGNHDRFVLRPVVVPNNPAVQFGIEFAASVITQENRHWLAELPLTWGGDIGGLTWLLFHGSPWRPTTDYIYPDSPLLPRLAGIRLRHHFVRPDSHTDVPRRRSAGTAQSGFRRSISAPSWAGMRCSRRYRLLDGRYGGAALRLCAGA